MTAKSKSEIHEDLRQLFKGAAYAGLTYENYLTQCMEIFAAYAADLLSDLSIEKSYEQRLSALRSDREDRDENA